MNIKQIFNLINLKFPFNDQAEWDQSGYLNFNNEKINDLIYNQNISGILLTLDIDEIAIQNAIQKKCNLIISHHPLFIDINLTKRQYFKNIFEMLIKNKIAVISCHTNFDINKKGMNYLLCQKIGAEDIQQLEENHYSSIATLNKKCSLEEFCFLLKKKFNLNYINSNNLEKKYIKKICFCGGSGSSEISIIKKKHKVDAFITSEIKWNFFTEVKNFYLLEVPHYVEYIFVDFWFKFFTKKFNTLKVYKIEYSQVQNKIKTLMF